MNGDSAAALGSRSPVAPLNDILFKINDILFKNSTNASGYDRMAHREAYGCPITPLLGSRPDRGSAEYLASLGPSEVMPNGRGRAGGEFSPSAESPTGRAVGRRRVRHASRLVESAVALAIDPVTPCPALRCAVPRSGKPDRLANTMTLPSRYLFRRVQ